MKDRIMSSFHVKMLTGNDNDILEDKMDMAIASERRKLIREGRFDSKEKIVDLVPILLTITKPIVESGITFPEQYH